TQVLQALAAHRPQARRAEVLREAVAALPTGDEGLLPRALESLVPVLPDELLADVFALISSLQELHWKREVLAVVAPRLPAFMLSQALVEARRIGDGAEAAQTVAEISSLLPLTERRAALRDALALALTIGNDFQRASALAALAAALPQPERAQALAAGLAAARAVRNRYERVEALVSIGGHMPEEGRAAPLSEALADVKAIGEHAEDSSVREALADLAPQLPQPMLGEALRTARRISHRGHRAWALATLVPHLSGARRIRVIGEALSDAGATDDDYARLAAVETLASCLPQRFVPQALSVAQGIGDSIWCQSALVTLAPRMTPRQRTQLLGEDWETAYAEAARTERVLALASRAAHLPEEERGRAAHEALSIRDDSSRLEALVALIPHLPERARDEALTAGLTLARAIVDPYARAVSLARLAPAIPGSGRGRTLETALAAARAVHDRPSRLKALATVAGALPAARRARVLAEALDAAAGSRDQAGGPPVRRRSDILADVRALGPSIASLGGAPAIGAVLQAILDVEAWWP
ncbi:MAG TPA: hypothetical protein VHN78_03515, partial [Chloroflexota bacterium]|nr:hypothetical protein [Chloroflexota bacterium]